MRERLRDPVTWTNASQLLKTVAAAVIAWVRRRPRVPRRAGVPGAVGRAADRARHGVPQLARRAAGRGDGDRRARRVRRGDAFGVNAFSLGVAVLAGLLAGSMRGLRSEATTAARPRSSCSRPATATTAACSLARLLDTAIGIGAALLVNLLVWPPLRDRGAAHQIDASTTASASCCSTSPTALRAGEAGGVDEWIARTTRSTRTSTRRGPSCSQARESGRLNLRRAASVRMRAAEGFERDPRAARARRRPRRAAWSRTIRLARMAPEQWDARFRAPWLELLRRAGIAIAGADAGAIAGVRRDSTRSRASCRPTSSRERLWPAVRRAARQPAQHPRGARRGGRCAARPGARRRQVSMIEACACTSSATCTSSAAPGRPRRRTRTCSSSPATSAAAPAA